MTPEFNAALIAFVAAAQAKINEHFKLHAPNLYGIGRVPKLSIDPAGIKYLRIVSDDGPSRSVFCFVRKADGAILKAAGWKAPAKHARGSIFINEGRDAVSVYGAHYIR